ncbi:MAG: D-arabinono-1,4-lactone oxidase [Gemmataceae bacterium]
MTRPVANFGGDIRFTPKHLYRPRTEAEVLAVLDRHAGGKVRVVGARHSWNPGIASADALLDLRYLRAVAVHRAGGEVVAVTAGGGCRMKHLLGALHRRADATLPSVGLITEQTVAGVVSTATHGSGKHSLSHYVEQIRVAAYDPATGRARVYTWGEGDPELAAARCAVGCMGVVLAVRFRCVPRYDVEEVMHACDGLDEVLAGEARYPLQQFYLAPHRWTYFAQRRAAAQAIQPRSLAARLYRAWWFLGIDVGLHLIFKLLVSVVQSPPLTRWFFRRALPRLVLRNVTIVDRAERVLVMEHELFRHLEIELFVPARHLPGAVGFVRAAVNTFAGVDTDLTPVADPDLRDELRRHCGTFTHHYPITFRRVLPDDTLISPTASASEPWYAISFITYAEPRGPFLAFAGFLARGLGRLFGARLHWGKHFPLGPAEVEAAYPRLPEFRAHCERVDPRGVFRNGFAGRVLFGAD